MKRIVVGVSFRSHWKALDAVAARLAHGSDAEIVLTHVGADKAAIEDLRWDVRMLQEFRDEGLGARLEWRQGDPVDQLVAAVDEHAPSILLVGASTVHDPRRGFLGGNTQRLIQRVASPLVVVPTKMALPPRDRPWKVVYATDLSEEGLAGLREAERLAAAFQGELRVLHVVKGRHHGGLWSETGDPTEGIGATSKLAAAVEHIAVETDIDPEQIHVLSCPSVAYGILDESERLEADVIILATRAGDPNVSVAQAVLRLSEVPVCLLRR
jgi:nucleotide-binding universal stress UspA family protein